MSRPAIASTLAWVTTRPPRLPPGHAEGAQDGDVDPAATHRDGQRVSDGAERQQQQEHAEGDRQHLHVPQLRHRRRELVRPPEEHALLRAGQGGELLRHGGRAGARAHGDQREVELQLVPDTVRYPPEVSHPPSA